MENILTTSLRTLLGFGVLFLLTRVLGKKQLSQMTFFTYITGIALGNIAGDMVVHRDIKLINGVTGLTLWAFLTLTIEYIALKSPKARILLDGEPTIIIKQGKINEKAMKSNKLNMDDLTMLLRIKNVFSIKEVDYAILEPNGQISVLKKVEYENVINKNTGIPITPRKFLPSELVVDGRIVKKNLTELSLSEDWLANELKKKGINRFEEVFYAELQSDGKVVAEKRSK
ncbi:YetF domain-containing protein [Mesobacillus thioparans]|uniref:YetF domain-containing protein n=1 Tax=Mesobacillus thioparans TaxID=370439 RepID=UPI0039EF9708